MERMTNEEYSDTQQKIILLARFARDLDLDGFLGRIQDAHAVVPILDPTLYMKGHAKLEQVEALARSLVPFRKEIDRQIEEATA